MKWKKEKLHTYIWYILWFVSVFSLWLTDYLWVGYVAFALLGLTLVIYNKEYTDDLKEYYKGMSKKIPLLYPPEYVEKTSWTFQRGLAIFVGVVFLVAGLFELYKDIG